MSQRRSEATPAWAQDFVQNPYEMDLHKETTYDEIVRVQVDGSDVVISTQSWFHEIRLNGWHHERPHRAQVRRLIERLGFEETSTKSGTYEAHLLES